MGGVKEVDIRISDLSDGLNTADPASDVGRRFLSNNGRKQVADALDFMLHTKKQRPGSDGASGIFTTYCRGLGTYLRHDGTEYLLSMSGGKLYSHLTTSPYTKTELYDLGGSGEAYFADYLDICVVCNGNEVVKVEGASAYQLGIAAPTGASVAAQSGGTLPDGAYKVIVGYARTVDSSNVLYSRGQDLGTVTLSGGNNTVRVTFPNSSDSQVNNKVVWMTDAAGTVYYFYHETGDNTTATVDVSSATSKNSALLYSTQAQRNYAVPDFEHILFHNGYLYGSVDNTLYRSLRAGSRYDLERFDTRAAGGNTADYPFEITGLFAIGLDVFLNTPAGIFRLPNGDIDAEYDHVEKSDAFKWMKTLAPWNGGVIGLTNQKHALAFFDGQKFFPHDLAQDIKPDIDAIYDDYNTDLPPSACIYRRSDRTEYHLLYKKNSITPNHHSRRAILNLNSVQFLQETRVRASWETWSNGAAYMVVDNDNKWYCAQSLADDGCIYIEHASQNRDKNIYRAGTLETDAEYGWSFKTGRIIHSIRGIVRWFEARLYAKYSAPITIALDASLWPDNTTYSTEASTASGTEPRYGIAQYGVDRYAPEQPVFKKKGLARSLKGIGVIVTLSGTQEDRSLEFYEALILGYLTQSRFT